MVIFGGTKLYSGRHAHPRKYSHALWSVLAQRHVEYNPNNFSARATERTPKQSKIKGAENLCRHVEQMLMPTRARTVVPGVTDWEVSGTTNSQIYKTDTTIDVKQFATDSFKWVGLFAANGYRQSQNLLTYSSGQNAATNVSAAASFSTTSAITLASTNSTTGEAGKMTSFHLKAYPLGTTTSVEGTLYFQRTNRRMRTNNAGSSYNNMKQNQNEMFSIPFTKIQEEGGFEIVWCIENEAETMMASYDVLEDLELGTTAFNSTNDQPWLLMWFDTNGNTTTVQNWKFEITVTGDVVDVSTVSVTGKNTDEFMAPTHWKQNLHHVAKRIRSMNAHDHTSAKSEQKRMEISDETCHEILRSLRNEVSDTVDAVAKPFSAAGKAYKTGGVLGGIGAGLHALAKEARPARRKVYANIRKGKASYKKAKSAITKFIKSKRRKLY